MRRELVSTLLWIASGVAGLILLYFLYPSVHPWSTIRLPIDDEGIRRRSGALLTDLNLDAADYSIIAKLRQEGVATSGRNPSLSNPEAEAEPDGSESQYLWNVRVFKTDPEGVTSVRISNSEDRAVERLLNGDLSAKFDTRGMLRSLTLPVPDSLSLPSLDSREALDRARSFVRKHVYAKYHGPLASEQPAHSTPGDTAVWSFTDFPGHRLWTYSWAVWDRAAGDSVDVRIELAGNAPSKFSLKARSKPQTSDASAGFADDILQVLFYAVLSILLIVTGIRRLRAYEFGFRTAFFFGTLTALSFGLWFYFQIMSEAIWEPELLLPLVIAPLLVGAAMVVIWAVGESVGRETWKEKFITVDLLIRGYVLHSRIGHSLLRGLGGGAAIAAAGLLAVWVVAPLGNIGILQKSDSSFDMFSSAIPALFVIGETFNAALFEFTFAVLFFVSFLRQKIRATGLVLAIAAVVIALPNPLSLTPPFLGILATAVPALLVVVLFVFTDVIGALVGLTAATIIHKGAVLLLPWNLPYQSDGILLLLVAGVVILYAITALGTRDAVLDFEEIAPRFQRHISERQRLSRELEIAREVQMSFLPKRDPLFEGLDIASRCAPAMEVGGDYYDFIDLGPDKIGIAIGDVSGKGTQAAFYMTLTKGFLKALGRISTSPSRVLVEMNRLFYENVERGNFISMIYAVFDLREGCVTIARAGHTPVMRMNAEHRVDIIQSRGMALGFEAGEKFESTIEEVRLPIRKGDIFVLYTDGYPEAMTTRREEFGEERLSLTLQRHAGDSAAQVIDGLYRETRRFAGKAEQHDDMTMVVVRVC